MREGDLLDLHVIPPGEGLKKPKSRVQADPTPWGGYLSASVGVLAVTLLNFGFARITGYWSLALFYLLAILLMSLRLGRGPLLLAATLSALAWDYLFHPAPLYFLHREV